MFVCWTGSFSVADLNAGFGGVTNTRIIFCVMAFNNPPPPTYTQTLPHKHSHILFLISLSLLLFFFPLMLGICWPLMAAVESVWIKGVWWHSMTQMATQYIKKPMQQCWKMLSIEHTLEAGCISNQNHLHTHPMEKTIFTVEIKLFCQVISLFLYHFT